MTDREHDDDLEPAGQQPPDSEPTVGRDFWIPPEDQPKAKPPAAWRNRAPEPGDDEAGNDDGTEPDAEHDGDGVTPPSSTDAPAPATAAEAAAAKPAKTLRQVVRSLASAFSECQSPKKRLFLAAYAMTGSKARAAQLAGVDATLPYKPGWRDDAGFLTGLERAKEMYGEVLEAELHRRAVEGTVKPVGWHKGRPGGYLREHSDLLMIFRTKAFLRAKYGDSMQIGGVMGLVDYGRLDDSQLARIVAGEDIRVVLNGGVLRALPAAPLGGIEGTGTRDEGSA